MLLDVRAAREARQVADVCRNLASSMDPIKQDAAWQARWLEIRERALAILAQGGPESAPASAARRASVSEPAITRSARAESVAGRPITGSSAAHSVNDRPAAESARNKRACAETQPEMPKTDRHRPTSEAGRSTRSRRDTG
jgi:hypothetical protein